MEADGVVTQVDTSLDASYDAENITAVGDSLALEAWEDRIIILEDRFKTGLECKTCHDEGRGTGFEGITNKSTIECSNCNGRGSYQYDAGFGAVKKCSQCNGSGRLVCPDCGGKGATLIAPEESQKRPSSGRIVSIGPEVGLCFCVKRIGIPFNTCPLCSGTGRKTYHLKVGDRVLYSQFMGTGIDFKQKGIVRVMREHEVFSRMHGIGELGKAVR